MCVLNGMQIRKVSLMHMHSIISSDRLIGKRKVSVIFETGVSLARVCYLTYLPGRGHKENQDKTLQMRRTRQSCDRVDCFVAPAIFLRPKAARDKGVGTVLCIDTRRVAKTFRVTHVTISLCGIHARALFF